MPTMYKWHPILDLADDPKTLTDGELNSLRRIWESQKTELSQRGALDEFDKRLRREWSIETGIIENVYTLDRGVTRTLIEKGIDAALIPHGATNRDTTLVARIIQDHYDTLEGMFDFVGGQRQLSTGYVKELHSALLRNHHTFTVVDQFGRAFEKPLDKGRYKEASNSPTRPDGSVHEYCPPEHVASEMDRLISMHTEHEARGVPPEVEAAWLQHRFTQIHPFEDGNGRVARAIASLVFIRAGWFPLIVNREDWNRYIEALEKADHNDLRPVVSLFVEAQRNALLQATDVAYDMKPIASVDEAIAAVRDRLLQRGKLLQREWLAAKNTADKLAEFALARLGEIAAGLASEIGGLGKGFTFDARRGQNLPPTTAEYAARIQLELNAGRQDELALFFYGVGPRYRGIINVDGHLFWQAAEPVLIKGGTFQINYEEDLSSAQARFSPWLEHVIVEGLAEWRRSL